MAFPLLAETNDALLILLRVLHTTCAGTLLGGLLYMRFVLAPSAATSDAEAVLFAGRRKAWAACVGICTALLLASGFYNFFTVIIGGDTKPAAPYHALFGVKFLLALVVFALSALIAGKSGGAVKVRANVKRWLNIALFCTLAIFVLGAYLRQIPRVPKPVTPETEAPAFNPSADGPADGPTSGDVPALPEP